MAGLVSVSVQHNTGPIDPAECAGHRRAFPAGRTGFAREQIRPDSDALWYNSARSNPEPAKWGSEQGSRAPRQQIRADGRTAGCQVSRLRHSKLDQLTIWDDERTSRLPQPRHCAGRWWGSAGSQPCRCRAGAKRLNERSRRHNEAAGRGALWVGSSACVLVDDVGGAAEC